MQTSRVLKIIFIVLSVWLISSVGMSNGLIAPELPILAKSASEYPLLRRLQDLTLDLQLLELTIKNRRDSHLEGKISDALKEIETEGLRVGSRFKEIRSSQLENLFMLFSLAKRHGHLLGVAPHEWDELLTLVSSGSLQSGTLTVRSPQKGILNVVKISPLTIGRQIVWNFSLPTTDRHSFWVQVRAHVQKATLDRKIALLNEPFNEAEELAKKFFADSYAKFYSSFEEHRYAILQRISMARKALTELSKRSGAMGAPEEYASLYNLVLKNLFSYGIDISLSNGQRDFTIKGFLFAESPERAQELLKKLEFESTSTSYSSPSS